MAVRGFVLLALLALSLAPCLLAEICEEPELPCDPNTEEFFGKVGLEKVTDINLCTCLPKCAAGQIRCIDGSCAVPNDQVQQVRCQFSGLCRNSQKDCPKCHIDRICLSPKDANMPPPPLRCRNLSRREDCLACNSLCQWHGDKVGCTEVTDARCPAELGANDGEELCDAKCAPRKDGSLSFLVNGKTLSGRKINPYNIDNKVFPTTCANPADKRGLTDGLPCTCPEPAGGKRQSFTASVAHYCSGSVSRVDYEFLSSGNARSEEFAQRCSFGVCQTPATAERLGMNPSQLLTTGEVDTLLQKLAVGNDLYIPAHRIKPTALQVDVGLGETEGLGSPSQKLLRLELNEDAWALDTDTFIEVLPTLNPALLVSDENVHPSLAAHFVGSDESRGGAHALQITEEDLHLPVRNEPLVDQDDEEEERPVRIATKHAAGFDELGSSSEDDDGTKHTSPHLDDPQAQVVSSAVTVLNEGVRGKIETKQELKDFVDNLQSLVASVQRTGVAAVGMRLFTLYNKSCRDFTNCLFCSVGRGTHTVLWGDNSHPCIWMGEQNNAKENGCRKYTDTRARKVGLTKDSTLGAHLRKCDAGSLLDANFANALKITKVEAITAGAPPTVVMEPVEGGSKLKFKLQEY